MICFDGYYILFIFQDLLITSYLFMNHLAKHTIAQQKSQISQPSTLKSKSSLYEFIYLREDRVETAADLMTTSMTQKNKYWKGAVYDEIKSVRVSQFLLAVKRNLAFGMVDNQTNQLVCCSFQTDLFDLLNPQFKMPHQSNFLSSAGKIAQEITKEEFSKLQSTAKKGEVVLTGGATNLKYINSGIIKQFMPLLFTHLKALGFKHSYSITKYTVWSKSCEIPMSDPGFQGELFRFYRLDLSQLVFDSLSKFLPDAEEDQLQAYQ